MDLCSEKAPARGLRALALGSMFSNPAATLASLRERPQWFLALSAAAACSVAVNFYLVSRIGVETLIGAVAQANAAIDPQAILENAAARKTQILLFQGLSTFLGTFLTALVVAKVLWLTLTMIGEEVPFKRVLAVVAHASWLAIVVRQSMMALTVTAIRDLDRFDLANPLATNAAFFIHPRSPAAHRLLASIDLLTFLNIFLLAFGLSKMATRLSIRKAHAVVMVPWGVYVGISLLLPWP